MSDTEHKPNSSPKPLTEPAPSPPGKPLNEPAPRGKGKPLHDGLDYSDLRTMITNLLREPKDR